MKLRFKEVYDQYNVGDEVEAQAFEPSLRQTLVDEGKAEVVIEKPQRETRAEDSEPDGNEDEDPDGDDGNEDPDGSGENDQ